MQKNWFKIECWTYLLHVQLQKFPSVNIYNLLWQESIEQSNPSHMFCWKSIVLHHLPPEKAKVTNLGVSHIKVTIAHELHSIVCVKSAVFAQILWYDYCSLPVLVMELYFLSAGDIMRLQESAAACNQYLQTTIKTNTSQWWDTSQGILIKPWEYHLNLLWLVP